MPYRIPRLFISATRKSSGKTFIAVGLTAALSARGLVVQPFKKGPDYIDPRWHSLAAGRECRNLDDFIMGRPKVLTSFVAHAQGADVAIIEGNLGLFDGQDLEGSDSSAALAKALGAPVLLVVDCKHLARSVAPLVCGHLHFPGGETIVGIILNNVATPRQEKRLREAIERFCPIPILGAIPRSAEIMIDERHLGLVPANEKQGAPHTVETMGRMMESHLDLDRLVALAATATPLALPDNPPALASKAPLVGGRPVRVGYAADQAFSFYYPDNLEALRQNGVELVPFSLLDEQPLPQVDGLYIGGGFPEMFMEHLQQNRATLETIRTRSELGMPIYAECGGLMVLSQRLIWAGKRVELAGALPIEITMHPKPQGYGYMKIHGTGALPWPPVDQEICCHEFHYSKVSKLGEGVRFAYQVTRGSGVDGWHDGILYHNIFASYAHIHVEGAPEWAPFLARFWRERGSFSQP
ncbi:cobyrinate a,c-diamide synthase / hydrogenobyrinic acid a,c-diamide synthase (glutamine-hydrolysing) [Magnetococcus marinus MC-1]|uniref:Cobyrinate a,c-diamide synthase n=1 Tax=Magnetococcus marinus (strain ATCC BAA-1437 / JCM 17883 / MC-1) TaxID=156889 RepID=CBIA_MAGMM|nr:cobyrinate a,c-diamide synthase [Magnetococcus marinus]A0L8B9.1 RecName: Full=Cobyrinate a,c-diamide synthase; AltName: Full=Cobyrinic acid a,c-diamide synthetase [Magnetococcus marinus MC-1]ABK44212.1 cobyrinate a,c-diamide synthase / hydrogenobyrinic acid a,c-diamide synthase (glutamine-hydrolysing) [Magnetococcus marinus MC-1]